MGQDLVSAVVADLAARDPAALLTVLVVGDGLVRVLPLAPAAEVGREPVCPPGPGASEGGIARLAEAVAGIMLQLDVDGVEVAKLTVLCVWDERSASGQGDVRRLFRIAVPTTVINAHVVASPLPPNPLTQLVRGSLVLCETSPVSWRQAADVLMRVARQGDDGVLDHLAEITVLNGADDSFEYDPWPAPALTDSGGDAVWSPRGAWSQESKVTWGRYRPGHIEVARVQAGRALRCWSLDNGTSWGDWWDFGFGDRVEKVALSTSLIGHLEAFALLDDGSVAHRWLSVDASTDAHRGWSAVHEYRSSAEGRTTDLAVGSIDVNHQEVFCVDADGTLWSRYWWHRSPWEWSGWQAWEVPSRVVAVEASRFDRGGALGGAVLIQLRDGRRLTQRWRKGLGWQGWESVPADAVATSQGIARASRRLLDMHGRRVDLTGTFIGVLPEGGVLVLQGDHPVLAGI